jgi:transposase-like protein
MKAVELLVSTDLTKGEVAAAVGVSTETLRRWRKDPDFRDELRYHRDLRPDRMHCLRMEAARKLLQDVICRMIKAEERVPLKDVTALLERLVGPDFDRAMLPPAAGEPSGQAEEEPPRRPGFVRPLPREEADALYAELRARENARRRARGLEPMEKAFSPGEGPCEAQETATQDTEIAT